MSARYDLARRAAPKLLRPSALVAVFYGTIVLSLLATHAFDSRFFAMVGPQWERHDPKLQRRADGFIFFEFSVDTLGAMRRYERLRTSRILYPATARALALGRAELVAWSMLFINLVAITLGTEILHRLVARRGLPEWTALAYGAWGGLGLALLHDTAEPLTYLCVLIGIEAQDRGHTVASGLAFLGALLTRETALLFVVPYLLARRDPPAARWAVPVTVLAAWGAWLGVVGLAGGGRFLPEEGKPGLPLVAYLQTRAIDLPATIVWLLAPCLVVIGWAAWELRRRPGDGSLWAAVLNGLMVLWFPSPTAMLLWHSGRLATGFVLATLLAGPLAASAPSLWRTLAALFATSACWTVAVTLRYLFWGVVSW